MGNWKLEDGVVEFPSGRKIRGRSWKEPVVEQAELSLVLTTVSGKEFASYCVFSNATQTVTIDWPDQRMPRRAAQAIVQLRKAWEQAGTQRVEITCRTGIGRTGTALAIIAVFEGMDPETAIKFVREKYNENSANSPAQREFLREYASQAEEMLKDFV